MNRFEEKVVLVTGAASGMGRATCIRLAAEGASVFGLDVDESGLAQTKATITDSGGLIEVSRCDVSSREQCFEAVDKTVAHFGNLHVLVNVAGIIRFGHTHLISEQEWNLTMGVNLNGPLFLCQASIPHLLASKGNIVNVASTAGLIGQAYCAAYCASKAGLIQLTKAMAMEYCKTSLRVNVVCPGGTDTEMIGGISMPDDVDGELINRYTPLRGNGQPEDIASAIAYIASDEARMIHGSVFAVDNGGVAG
ncbi:MAG: SDR family oxidoreductase [Halieaceae bacterium]|jgi:meso-butanediol dehydrogenase / (S,S)-butanediol dehydrogenase / diacetyl reductase|nr:SDR family oxidoreductase [Halieaceae bacterium]